MKDEAYFLKRFERVEELWRQVLSSVSVGGYGYRYVDVTLFAKWKTECITLLGSVMPNSAIYAEQLKLFVSQQPIDNATTFEHLWGVFNGAYDDFKAGMFDNLKLEIESSVSCDFLGQANALLNDKEIVDYSYLPAAVLTGAVLEKTLRSLCENANPKIETVNENGRVKKMSAMIVDLKKAGVINEIRSRQLETWNAIRNSAAHGKIEEFTKEQVAAMLQGVQDFMAQQMK